VSDQIKYVLDEEHIPKVWYNLNADFPKPVPAVLHPGTHQPVGPGDLEPLFPMELILQEVATERYIEIPEPVRDVFKMWRPSPLVRARRLEQALDTPAKIYFKYEGVSPAGSHKPNTAVPQAWYNQQAGIKKLSTETDSGRAILAAHPDSPGSLGIAISEAVEVAAKNPDIKYALGSVLNHVMLHQTIIGEETIKQFEMAGDDPDIVIACAGGGSNFAGLAFPYLGLQLRGGAGGVPVANKGQIRLRLR
jgi:tryptophan synthase beta chain